MLQYSAKILKHLRVGPDTHKLVLRAPRIARLIRPGQFLHVRCSDSNEPFLRRPFSVHRIIATSAQQRRKKTNDAPGSIEILYRVIGKGTVCLSSKKAGSSIDIIGPLGNGFTMPHAGKSSALIVAGGMGVAPLVALLERLSRAAQADIYAFIGGCSKEHILCAEHFKRAGAKLFVATEDGSKGEKGLITDLLCRFLRGRRTADETTIYACGPQGMLKAVSQIARNNGIPCQVSLEAHMACGVGACLGCPVKVKDRSVYKMVCKDGPVFDARRIDWSRPDDE